MDDLAQLLTAAQAGDEGAFEALARSQRDRLFSIAYRVTGDSSTAEDVVQEAFLRVLKSHSPLHQEGAAHAWLARVATRLALDAVRRQNARRRLEGRRAMTGFTPRRRPKLCLPAPLFRSASRWI